MGAREKAEKPGAPRDERQIVEAARGIILQAMEERRSLVAFTRLEAVEMDRRAREVEREALAQLQQLMPALPANEQLYGIQTRLHRMEEHLRELAARQDIQERSRALEEDDIRWRVFEDISWLLGIG